MWYLYLHILLDMLKSSSSSDEESEGDDGSDTELYEPASSDETEEDESN